MAALTPDEIADAGGCFSCFADRFGVLLYLLDQIRIESGGDAMTNDEIAEEAACFSCFADREAVALYLLNAIVTNGGAGGGGGLQGVVDPEGVVTAEPGTTYYNSANATFWVKASGSGNTGWIQLI